MNKEQIFKKTHEHLKSLKCPKCGEKMRKPVDRGHLVGCMEYQIFLCDKTPYETGNYNKPSCRILIINYPHESAEKDNRIIKL